MITKWNTNKKCKGNAPSETDCHENINNSRNVVTVLWIARPSSEVKPLTTLPRHFSRLFIFWL